MFTDGATRTGPAGNRNLMPEPPNDPNPGSSQKHLQEMLSNGSFEKYGVGGLDSEFLTIFRRVFASRMVDPEVLKKLGAHRALTNISQAHCSAQIRPDCLLIHITKYTHTLKTEEIDRFISSQKGMRHVKGMLLYGPPGTGKTLVAKQLGRLLNAHPPKIVNGPEILQRFVGQSEENMRDLFAPAEKEFKGKGDKVLIYCISIIPPTGCQHSTDTDPFRAKK
jgi:vesicle-fusing ATPase